MKTLLFRLNFALYLCLLPFTGYAGPEVVPSPTPAPTPPVINMQTAEDFAAQVAKSGNFSLAVSPGYAPKLGTGEWGIAILGGYQINQFLGAFLRADLFDHNYTVASGSMTAQVPITFGQKGGRQFTVRPFVEAGVGSDLGGSGTQSVFAIAGGGVIVDLWHSGDGRHSFSAGAAVETWEPKYSGISIYRGFADYTLHF